MELLTVGHGRLSREDLGQLLHDAGVAAVVDVRRFPGSRTNPDSQREALAQWLPDYGMSYRWEERLGGRRHLKRTEDEASPDSWWRVAAFRAYASYTRTSEFEDALTDVVAQAQREVTAVMCSESVWWRCHRRLIADVAVLSHGLAVRHLMPGGQLTEHEPAAGARCTSLGQVVWDG